VGGSGGLEKGSVKGGTFIAKYEEEDNKKNGKTTITFSQVKIYVGRGNGRVNQSTLEKRAKHQGWEEQKRAGGGRRGKGFVTSRWVVGRGSGGRGET